MGRLVQETFAVNLKIMRILGFYPPQKYKTLYKIYAYALYCLCTIPVPTLAILYLLLQDNVGLTEISENAFVICESGCFIFKLLPFITNGDEIRRGIYMLECPVFNMYTKNQEKIIEEWMSVCKRNSYSFLVFCIITSVCWGSTPFLAKEYKLPLDIWLPYDPTTGPKEFYLSLLLIAAGITSGSISNGMIDPLLAGLAYYATSQLKVLKDTLQHLSEYAEEKIANLTIDGSDKELMKDRIIYDKIKVCIDHHNAILNFVELYEKTYSWVVFTQFAASVLVICISCLQLSMVAPFTFSFFAMIIFIFTLLMEIFLYCFYGATLFEESNTLAEAIYMGKWYEYDIKSRKALIVLMERSKRPVIITAGKILDLSLATFTTILRRSYSLLAVLKSY